MKTILTSLALLLSLALPSAALADCYVGYKAKQDSPLRLHYGVLALPGSCPAPSAAQATAASRLAAGGWTLLTVLSTSGAEPDDQMKANAGEYYLRY
ncbi:hypothetical protein [Tropicibacter naphthalenivorans]|uniref:Uncharacterized protein n=1 Tax=Tropicibacter naphthalenivorans TaxID=441103 RepID=A0A0P1GKX7_9RHOB|nr:hypothetical protein [Tropicibacter naphthalenivorans]CUH82598.1 hypothetical protein TRN7648_04140 [Tropicibacter naphthalenivorans]SMD09562.1 hypothetical protein SAMN04488093_11931 [Tropicibacter naphthalenivorans]